MIVPIERPTAEAFALHKQQEKHKKENPLRDVILGGQDGLVNALGIILGVIAVTSDTRILLATVLSAAVAESISMGAVAYTSAVAQQDFYESERQKALAEIREVPHMEKEEVRRIFEKKGFSGHTLEEIVQTVTSDEKLWLHTMMTEELSMHPIRTNTILKSSVIVTIATAIGHLIPIVPFFFLPQHPSLVASIVVSAFALFATGVYQAVTLVGSWWKNGVRIMVIGLSAALIGYAIAHLFSLPH